MEFLRLLLISLTLLHFPLQSRSKILSRKRPAEQISTLNDSAAWLAVDGITISDKSCSVTTKIRNPWWQVHLIDGLARVKSVRIFGSAKYRNDLTGIKVFVSNSTEQTFTECASRNGTISDVKSLYLKCSAVARIVRIQLTGNTEKYLGLREVEVHGYLITRDTPLSRGTAAASQSSTYRCCYTGTYFPAFLAVDGIMRDHRNQIFEGKSCSSTNKNGRHWWQVELAGIARIRWVSVYSEVFYSGRLAPFNIMVSNSTEENFTKCATVLKVTKYGQVRHIKCGAAARIIRIQQINNNNETYLSLCEVKVHGDWVEKDELLSEGMTANQSSTAAIQFRYLAHYRASFALSDSKPKYCSVTARTYKPWWQVQFDERLARVRIVSIDSKPFIGAAYNRFKVLVSNYTGEQFSRCSPDIKPTKLNQPISVICDAVAKTVRIQLIESGRKYLTLCKVEVFGYWISD